MRGSKLDIPGSGLERAAFMKKYSCLIHIPVDQKIACVVNSQYGIHCDLMNKKQVLPGVWWVDIPEAGYQVLCGAPMDSIKHLGKLGFIRKVEKDGKAYELGPNVILLSDTPIQNGRFWNLAEFPVLHMLYRRGLGIPNHPENDGSKPILIGLKSQVERVLEYIQWGIYGLSSKKEMSDYGIPQEDLENLWQLKLKFAYGNIKPAHELIDTFPLEGERVVLPGNVLLQREALNRYTLQFADQSVSVDMNLPPGKDWYPSYSLDHINVETEYFSIIHCGEGNGWGPKKPCMGSIIIFRGHRYLIDAGPGIDFSLDALGIDISEIHGVFISHVHDDHFAGISTLMRGDRKIDVYLTRPVAATARFKLASLLGKPPEIVDQLMNIHYLDEDIWNDIDGLEVRPTMSPHPIETTIIFFRAIWKNGYKTYAHFADIISLKVLQKFIAGGGLSKQIQEWVIATYAVPADIKKIDAGRGLIHGSAKDFAEDPSKRLILSHIEDTLSDDEKSIGVELPFGVVDNLIVSRGYQYHEDAAKLLKQTLPGLLEDDYKLLLNGKVQRIAPGSQVLLEGNTPKALLFIIGGTIEVAFSKNLPPLRYTAGSLVGEIEILSYQPANRTYATKNHVKAIRIPVELYHHVLNKAANLSKRHAILMRRQLLYSGKFPGDVVSYPRLDDLAEAVEEVIWERGKRIDSSKDELYLLVSGGIEETSSGNTLLLPEGSIMSFPSVQRGTTKLLSGGSFMNLPSVLPHMELGDSPTWKVVEKARVAILPGSLIREVPNLMWALIELSTQS